MGKFSNVPIVAPIDFSDEADRAVAYAVELAEDSGNVTTLHVAPPLIGFEPGFAWDVSNDEERRVRLTDAFHHRYADPSFKGVKFEVRFGDPWHEIASFAEELHAGLIVISSHGRTGLAHLLIGSVAEKVVRLAPCPVLVLRA